MTNDFLSSAIKQFEYYKMLGEKAMRQTSGAGLFVSPNAESNSIALIVKHLWGNMLSRWTDFLHSDGEKEWRKREAEFENDFESEEVLWQCWEQGWQTLFEALRPLTEADLERIVYIRNQGHTVVEAVNRQLAHYAYHVGQIVYIAKMQVDQNWQSLSIPRGGSSQYNEAKFSQPKAKGHFTDEFLANPELE